MTVFEALILGLLQGLTEFIPVSSSGHLLIAHEIFGTGENTLAFDVALHVGTLFALLLYFRKDLFELGSQLFSSTKQGRLARLLLISTIPAALAGLFLSNLIDDTLRTPLVVVITLSFVALIMLYADRITKKSTKETDISTQKGLLVGVAQATALIPGVSRSGATITAGVLLGLSRKQAARFSFLLAIPIVAGSALGIFIKESDGLTTGNWQLAVGVTAAFISGLLAIKILLGVIERVGLAPFAYYRLGLALLVLIFLA